MGSQVIRQLTAVMLVIIFFSSNHQTAYSQIAQDKIKVIVTQSPKIVVKTQHITHNVCYGETKGAINIGVSGGYPPYKYYWSHGDTTQDVAALKAGVYKVAVYDKFSCSDTLNIVVKQPEKLLVNVRSVKHILCYGYNHGAIDIAVTGGTPPYKFRWNNGAETEDLEGLTSGRYSALITDANGCQEIIMTEVEEKSLIVRSLDNVNNILCYGDSTGSIDISVSGGVPPYTYLWNNGATTEDLKNLKAGVYEVIVKDSEGCTEVSTTKVNEPDPLSISLDEVRHLRCSGDFGGTININIQGGSRPYYYQWSNGAETQDIAGIPAGHYEVQVKDQNGCTGSLKVEVTEPDPLNAVLINTKNVLFYGGNNGAIDINITGGISPYEYEWDNGSHEQDISGLTAGSYAVRITDAIGCTKMMNFTITQPAPLVVKIDNVSNINCNGANSGEINISAYGGISPYTYAWSNGANKEDISSLVAGSYAVTVTDANGFKVKADTTLTEPPRFRVDILKKTDILCHGEHSGSVDLEVQGGIKPYRYSWSNGHRWQDLKDVAAGEYHVKITDANHCEQQLSVTIKQPKPLKVSFENITHIKCFENSDGAINVSTSGGIEPYRFEWSNSAQTEDIANIPAGNYKLTVTDANGCAQQITTQITRPPLLTLREELVQHVDCHGNASGAIHLSTVGGAAPYSYAWNNGATTKNNTNLIAGRYSVEVTDANGCRAHYSQTITQPEKLTASVINITPISCFDEPRGDVDISVTGGVEPFTYKWSNGAVTQDIVGVKAGTYSVLIADANGCTDSLSAVINQNPLLTALSQVTHINCNGEKSGAVKLQVNGGVAPYVYKWSNGASTKDISGLAAGNYAVTITDAEGCSKTLDTQVVEPSKFVASLASATHIDCHGEKTGQVQVRVSGGAEPYVFQWNNGATTKDLTGVAAGEYQLTATDANGCVRTVDAVIRQPDEIKYSIKSITHVSCFSEKTGAIDIAMSGGIGPYTYAWSNGAQTQDLHGIPAGIYNVKITDAKGCTESLANIEVSQPGLLEVNVNSIAHINQYGKSTGAIDIAVSGGTSPYAYSWSNGASSQDISAVAGGNYSVNVKDARGCEKVLSVMINQPPSLLVKLSEVNNIKCHGDNSGAIKLSVSGGKPPYQFMWSNGESTRDIMGLEAGNYSVQVTDANGNTKVLETAIAQPSPLTIHLDAVQNLLCYNGGTGAIEITATGGTKPYNYQWNTGSGDEDINGLASGTYSVTVTDRNNCTSSLSVEVSQPDIFEARLTEIKHVNCKGAWGGEIHLEVKGGVKPYSYFWNTGERTKDLTGIPAGDYMVKVADANGCSYSLDTTISEPSDLVVVIESVTDNLCFGDSLGTITTKVTGGIPPYTFNWNNGSITPHLENRISGDYAVTVTDSNGCQKTVTTTINEPPALLAKIEDIVNVSCHGETTGKISINVTGGMKPYNYQWNTGATEKNLDNLKAGHYQLTITDQNGCSRSLEAEVKAPEPLTVRIDTIGHILCSGDDQGFLDVTVLGGNAPYIYTWSNGGEMQDLENLSAGKYNLKVEDANGCFKEITATINEPAPLTVSVSTIMDVKCWGDQTGEIHITTSGGVAPYQYQWNNGSTAHNIINAPAGNYKATVTDANGCVTWVNATISQPPKLIATIDAITNIRCSGDTSGSISVTALEGVAPFKFRWSNGATTKDLRGISAGEYELTITQGNGCETILKATVEEPTLFTAVTDKVTNVKCNGDSTGSVTLLTEGGVAPYNFSWSNGSTNKDLMHVPADSYSVMITDGNGCIKTLYTKIKEPPALSLQIDSVKNVKCCGDDNGAIFITVEGGVKPYDYLWSNGATTEDITKLVLGEYTVEVSDANNCSISSLDEMNLYEQVVTTGKFISRDILFDVGKSTIKAESFTAINKIASFLKQHPEISFRIDGHTDSDGTFALNQTLSEERAASVKQALIKFGIWESRLSTSGFGESAPIASNDTAEGKALNRRVEFILLTGTMEGLMVDEVEF